MFYYNKLWIWYELIAAVIIKICIVFSDNFIIMYSSVAFVSNAKLPGFLIIYKMSFVGLHIKYVWEIENSFMMLKHSNMNQ